MKIKDQETWNKYKEANQDPYGSQVIHYAERWADLIEKEIETSGKAPLEVIETHADKFSHEADTSGITGFMYGMAVSTLFQVWEHGDLLRRWHNLETQLGNEGEKANENGGVLNPAVLVISPKE